MERMQSNGAGSQVREEERGEAAAEGGVEEEKGRDEAREGAHRCPVRADFGARGAVSGPRIIGQRVSQVDFLSTEYATVIEMPLRKEIILSGSAPDKFTIRQVQPMFQKRYRDNNSS